MHSSDRDVYDGAGVFQRMSMAFCHDRGSGANTMSDGVMLDMLKSTLPLERLTRALQSKCSIHGINIHAPTEGEVAPSTRLSPINGFVVQACKPR